MRIVFKFFLPVLLLTVLCTASHSHAASNQSFPTIDEDGLVELVAPHEGKIIILNFFASWCPPCREEIPGLISLRKKFGEDKVFILGLSIDQSLSALKKFVRNTKINYPVVRAAGDVTEIFGVRSIPHNVVFDKNVDIVVNAAGFVSERELTRLINELLGSK